MTDQNIHLKGKREEGMVVPVASLVCKVFTVFVSGN